MFQSCWGEIQSWLKEASQLSLKLRPLHQSRLHQSPSCCKAQIYSAFTHNFCSYWFVSTFPRLLVLSYHMNIVWTTCSQPFNFRLIFLLNLHLQTIKRSEPRVITINTSTKCLVEQCSPFTPSLSTKHLECCSISHSQGFVITLVTYSPLNYSLLQSA